MPDSLSTPLSKEELDDFGNYLESIPGAMNLERIHGFMTSVLCSPHLALPSDFFPIFFGDDHVFDSQDELAKYIESMVRMWEDISQQLRLGVFTLLLREQGNGKFPGNEWAEGYYDGMELYWRDWQDLINDEEAYKFIAPIFGLAQEFDPEKINEKTNVEFTANERNSMLVGIKAYMPKVFEYFTPKRRSVLTLGRGKQVPVRRAPQKVGRNDPCPCNSGQKYKKCCGKSR